MGALTAMSASCSRAFFTFSRAEARASWALSTAVRALSTLSRAEVTDSRFSSSCLSSSSGPSTRMAWPFFTGAWSWRKLVLRGPGTLAATSRVSW